MIKKIILLTVVSAIFWSGCLEGGPGDDGGQKPEAASGGTGQTEQQETPASNSPTTTLKKVEIKTVPWGADPAGDVRGDEDSYGVYDMVDITSYKVSVGEGGFTAWIKTASPVTREKVQSNDFGHGSGLVFVIQLAQMDGVWDDVNREHNMEADRLCTLNIFHDRPPQVWVDKINPEGYEYNSPSSAKVEGLDTGTLTVSIPGELVYSQQYQGSYDGQKYNGQVRKKPFAGCGFNRDEPVYTTLTSYFYASIQLEDRAPDELVSGSGRTPWYRIG